MLESGDQCYASDVKEIIMRLIACLACLLFPSAAHAQPQPSKLLVLDRSGGVGVTEYPTKARCERARQEIEEIVREQNSKPVTSLPGGGIITPQRLYLRAFCISG